MANVTKFKVGMTCEGCSSACTRILNKIEGVTDVKCDMDKKEIHVEGDADTNEMLQALLKWSKASGKSVELLS
uniref:HMA domain-containing protein n=1 Tax=Hyaloperonospora arabidopsidis (strain Emoy2) TaxID=559515 RepID=M4B1N9_HYAAE